MEQRKLDDRKAGLCEWLAQFFPQGVPELKSLNGDASFRRYYRVDGKVAVDAPPQTQKNREFLDISRRLRQVGLRVPAIYQCDIDKGYMLQEDLGHRPLAALAVSSECRDFYLKAAGMLAQLAVVDSTGLPLFDKDFILTELGIFREWLLEKKLGLNLSAADQEFLEKTFLNLADEIRAQPQSAMHRDFHSRNIMVLQDESLALIDFQDMVKGPLCYDLASLIYDCYLNLPAALCEELIALNFRRYHALGKLPYGCSIEDFRRYILTVSLQRHLKVLGLFCRLSLRDGKDGYLKDLPRVLAYTLSECDALPDFAALGAFLRQQVQGRL